jgi:protein phosphatase
MNAEYFESAEVSDVGRKRKNNEDACLRIPERGIYCVADGMGGQAGGDLASESITTSLQRVFTKAVPEEDATFSSRIALFRKATNQASKWIKNFADEKVIGQMGSTLVALVFNPHNPARAVALHAGDSRLYRYRKGKLEQITTDHSAIAALAAKLGRSAVSIPAKYQNELLRAVGLTESVELETTPVNVASGDVFLICTDGLTKMLSDERIAKILKDGAKDPLFTLAQTLINAANEAGGKDNVTVVLVKAGDISSAPNVIDPDEEEEGKTVAAPTTPPPGEDFTPTTARLGAIPDSTDIHGDTPPTPLTKGITTVTQTPKRPPIPASTPKTSPEIPAAKVEIRTKINTAKNPEKNKSFPLGIIILAAVVIATSVGVWFAINSKSKPAKPAAIASFAPSPPAVVATTPAKPQFMELLKQAAGEQKLLADLESLKQSGNWQAVADSVAGPAYVVVTSKTPFQLLGQWVRSQADQAEKQKRLQQATVTFEEMLVWFNIKDSTDPHIQTAEARKQKPVNGSLLDQDRQKFLALVPWLESEYSELEKLGQNNLDKISQGVEGHDCP